VDDNERTMEGALVDIKDGSGLIKRCPDEDCTRVIRNGRCSEHGDVSGEFDLRIKGVLDDGEQAQDALNGLLSDSAVSSSTARWRRSGAVSTDTPNSKRSEKRLLRLSTPTRPRTAKAGLVEPHLPAPNPWSRRQ
jgi:hypothetical protein